MSENLNENLNENDTKVVAQVAQSMHSTYRDIAEADALNFVSAAVSAWRAYEGPWHYRYIMVTAAEGAHPHLPEAILDVMVDRIEDAFRSARTQRWLDSQ